jgi:hypothetical protein
LAATCFAAGRTRTRIKDRFWTILLVAGVLLGQFPDWVQRRDWALSSSRTHAAGHKLAAAEIKARGLVAPGKVIIARKPFLPYYLEGKWYVNPDTGESLPFTLAGLLSLVDSGKGDYLALDSYTCRELRPQLLSAALGLPPLPRGRIVYSRYFPQFDRIITLYDLRQNEPALESASVSQHLRHARHLYEDKNLPLALRELEAGLAQDAENPEAWRLKRAILQLYYRLSFRHDLPSRAYFPSLLPSYLSALESCARLFPEDLQVQRELALIKDQDRRERDGLLKRKGN